MGCYAGGIFVEWPVLFSLLLVFLGLFVKSRCRPSLTYAKQRIVHL